MFDLCIKITVKLITTDDIIAKAPLERVFVNVRYIYKIPGYAKAESIEPNEIYLEKATTTTNNKNTKRKFKL